MNKQYNLRSIISADSIINIIKPFKIVSFDIFDTLLKRNIDKPTDVFSYMELYLPDTFKDFKKKRINAEKKARKKNKYNEITIENIYSQFVGFSNSQKKHLINLELDSESKLLIANHDIKKVYDFCITTGKTVYLISDMYLPVNYIKEILSREGFIGYKKLYVSSEEQKTKRSGKLFETVLKDNNIIPQNMIHIGDSFISDYRTPQHYKIQAIHIPTTVRRSTLQTNFPYNIHINILKNFINNTTDICQNEYYRFGYEKFGMFLWGYVNWLKKQLETEHIEDVYFFSRDGFIIKKAFDLINHTTIHSHYLEVSRRSLRIPILWMDFKFETILNMISPSKLLSINAIFDGVGLNIYNYQKLLVKYGFDFHTTFDRKNIEQNRNLKKLYHEISNDIYQISKNEYYLLKKYIEHKNLKGKFAIVDIGWSGGMQRYLDKMLSKLEINHQIKGYYIGVADYYKRNISAISNLDLHGYLFDFSHNKDDEDKRNSFVGLFETFFLEQDGSVQNYYVDAKDNMIKAKRYPYEYKEDGEFTREYLCIKKLQDGALAFIRRASIEESLKAFHYTSDELFMGLKQTGTIPTFKDIQMFADFRFFDEGETRYLAAPKKLIYYIFHVRELKQDFLLSRWKIGFMKRLFKINLPYVKLYYILLKYK